MRRATLLNNGRLEPSYPLSKWVTQWGMWCMHMWCYEHIYGHWDANTSRALMAELSFTRQGYPLGRRGVGMAGSSHDAGRYFFRFRCDMKFTIDSVGRAISAAAQIPLWRSSRSVEAPGPGRAESRCCLCWYTAPGDTSFVFAAGFPG